jgi:hypothetical protein
MPTQNLLQILRNEIYGNLESIERQPLPYAPTVSIESVQSEKNPSCSPRCNHARSIIVTFSNGARARVSVEEVQ